MSSLSLLPRISRSLKGMPERQRSKSHADLQRLMHLRVRTSRDAAAILLDERRRAADRAICCWALRVAGASKMIPELLVAFRGPSVVTWEVAKALTIVADASIVPLLETLVIASKRAVERAASAYVLGVLGTRRSGACLSAAFVKESSKEARQCIVEAIGRLGGGGDKRTVIRAMNDKESNVRASAYYACGQLKMIRFANKLRKIAASGDSWESQCAAEAAAVLAVA